MSQPTTEQPTMAAEVKDAFALGQKMTVTPRGGEPTEIWIRPFYVDQALEVIDDIERIWKLMGEAANDKGDVNLFEVFKQAKDEVLGLIIRITEKDRAFIGRLELPDLMRIFQVIFKTNKDFFDQEVAPTFREMFGLLSSTQ